MPKENVLKIIVALIFCALLLGCSSSPVTVYRPVCLDSEDAARNLGNEIYGAGFNNRVSYWVKGDINTTISGLGLSWAGFSPTEYCPNGGYPIVIWYTPKESELQTSSVLRWSQIVLTTMLRERGIEK